MNKIKYDESVVEAVQRLLERGKAYIDSEGFLALYAEREETTFDEVVHRIREGTYYEDYDWCTGPALRALDRTVQQLDGYRETLKKVVESTRYVANPYAMEAYKVAQKALKEFGEEEVPGTMAYGPCTISTCNMTDPEPKPGETVSQASARRDYYRGYDDDGMESD